MATGQGNGWPSGGSLGMNYWNLRPPMTDIYRAPPGGPTITNNNNTVAADDVRVQVTTGFAETGENFIKRHSNWGRLQKALLVARPTAPDDVDGDRASRTIPDSFLTLLREGQTYDADTNNEKYHLHKLARDGDYRRIQTHLQKLCPEKKKKAEKKKGLSQLEDALDIFGLSPLHYAVRENHLLVALTLIYFQADVNLGSRDERATPLHFAARYMLGKQDCSKREQDRRANVLGLRDEDMVSALIDAGANSRAVTIHKRTPLHFAAIRGNVFAVQTLLKLGSEGDLEARDAQGKTALHLAVTHEHYPVIVLLVEEGARIHRGFRKNETTPFHVACRTGNTAIVQLLMHEEVKVEKDYVRSAIAQKMMESPDASGETPLHLAVRSEREDTVRALLAKNPRVDFRTSHGETVLHIAVFVRSFPLIKLLVEEYGASIDAMDNDGASPLERAAAQNHESCLQSRQSRDDCTLVFLLKKTAELKRCDINWDPLMAAARSSHPEVVNLLLSDEVQHPSVNMKHGNFRDQTAVWVAASIGDISTLRVLLEHDRSGNTLHIPDQMGYTPLHIAAEKGHIDCVRELLEKNAGIDVKNVKGEGPIHVATRANRSTVVKELLSRQVGLISSKDGRGRTILHLAAKRGQDRTAEEIIKHCPRIDEKDARGLTPLMTAAAYGKHRICKLLIDMGAAVDRTPADRSHSTGEQKTALLLACEEGHLSVVSLLLDHHADVTEVDDKGRNCLSLAIDHDHKDIAELIVSSSIWNVAMKNMMLDDKRSLPDTPMRKAIRKMPDIAEHILQKCIQSNEGEPHDGKKSGENQVCQPGWPINSSECEHFRIVYGCEFIDDTPVVENGGWAGNWLGRKTDVLGNKRIKENHPLMIMYEEKQLGLLNHIVVYELLRNKWKYGAWAFFLNLALYSIYVMMLTLYICTVPSAFLYYSHSATVLANMTPNTSYCDAMRKFYFTTTSYHESQRISNQATKYTIIVVVSLKILVEFFQLAKRKIGYFWEVENYIEWVMYISAILLVVDLDPCLKDTGLRTSWQWQVGAVAILLTWIDFILFLQKAPRFGTFIIMLQHVSIEILRLVPLLFLSILAFALAFFALLHNQVPFSGVESSLLKTFVMTLGEFEFQSTLLDPDEEGHSAVVLPEATFMIFVVFMIFMAIVFMNLLTGVAVNDIARTKNKALATRRRMQIELALDVDTTLRRLEEYGRVLPCIKRGTFMSKMRQRDIVVFPNRKTRSWFELLYIIIYGRRRSPKVVKALSQTVAGKNDFDEEAVDESMSSVQQNMQQLMSRMAAMETWMAKIERNMRGEMQDIVQTSLDRVERRQDDTTTRMADLEKRMAISTNETNTLLRKLTEDLSKLIQTRASDSGVS